jgi:hypothetical protein
MVYQVQAVAGTINSDSLKGRSMRELSFRKLGDGRDVSIITYVVAVASAKNDIVF